MLEDDKPMETLTGKWKGYYSQEGDRRKIVAVITQEGERILGTMTDLETVIERSLYDAVAKAGMQPGMDEQLDEQIRQMIPDAGDEPIMIRDVLPEASQLAGTVSGEFVRFTKRYQGPCVQRYAIGDKGISNTSPGHEVQYSGRLSGDRNTISGRWTIYQQEAPNGFLDGSFELKRNVGDES